MSEIIIDLDKIAPQNVCDRCGRPEAVHTGVEKFCPFYSTFRRSPDQPSGGTLSEDLLAIASGLEIGREQAAQALAAHVANIREIASRLRSSSTEMGEAVKDIANLLTGWAWERPQRDETEIARVIVERLRSSSITAADPAASSSGADAEAPDDVSVTFGPADGREPTASVAHSCGCFSWWALCSDHEESGGPSEIARSVPAPAAAPSSAGDESGEHMLLEYRAACEECVRSGGTDNIAWRDELHAELLARLRARDAGQADIHPHAAILGFMGWLTTRNEVAGPFSARDNASQAAELVAEFAKSQEWSELPDGWPDMLKPYPRSTPPAASEGGMEAEYVGWPPTRATVMAFSQFIRNKDVILNRVAKGEAITLTINSRRVATLIKPRAASPGKPEETTPPADPEFAALQQDAKRWRYFRRFLTVEDDAESGGQYLFILDDKAEATFAKGWDNTIESLVDQRIAEDAAAPSTPAPETEQ